MEAAGLGIGIASLAGIFSTCLDVVERIDSYKDFGVDSRALISQFNADRLLFQQWGEAVGFDKNILKNVHHQNLDNPATFAAVQNLLVSINEIAGGPPNISASLGSGSGFISSRPQTNIHQRLSFQKFREPSSRRTKAEWALRDKARFVALLQRFETLVDRLRVLVPPENTENEDQMARRTQTGIYSSADGMCLSLDQETKHIRFLDSQRIFLELEKQIERKTSICVILFMLTA
jgi:hypothetical protein